MRHLNKLFGIAIAVGLTMVVTGCGGSSYLTEGPAEGTGENYVAVEMEVGASGAGYLPSAPDLAKDAGGDAEARIEEGGVGQSEDVMSYVKCEFVNGIVPDGGGETFTPGGIEVVDFASYPGDCDNESACIGCYNRFEIADSGGNPIPDLSESHCIWNCVGIVPEGLLENDTAALDLLWKVKLITNEPSEGINIMRFDYNTPFPTIFETDMSDIASATSDDYDLSLCDESGDVEEMGVSLADDPLTTADPSTFDAFDDNAGAGPIVATKGLDVTGMGNPVDGYSDCYVEVQIDGDLLVSVDQSEGTHLFCANYCNDHTSCANFCGGGYFSAGDMQSFELAYADADNNEVTLDGASGVALNILGVDFANYAMLVSSVNEATVLLEFDNIHANMSQPVWSDIGENPQTLLDGIDDDEFLFVLAEDKIDYAHHSGVLILDNVISQAGLIMPYPLVAEFTAGPALGDKFYIDSNTAYTWNTSITNEPNAIDANFDDWQEISGAGALAYNVSGTDDNLAWVGDDAGPANIFIRGTKLAAEPDDVQLELDIANIANIDSYVSMANADFFRKGILESDYDGYMIGVQAADFAADGAPFETIVFGVQMAAGVVANGGMCDLGANTDVIVELTNDNTSNDIYMRFSTDGGSTWSNLEDPNDCAKYTGATNQDVTFARLSGDVYLVSEYYVYGDAAGNDAALNIESDRAYGAEDASSAPNFTEDAVWEGNIGQVGP